MRPYIMQVIACVSFLIFFFVFYFQKSVWMAMICAIAFASYAAINCDIGKITSTSGSKDYIPRYIDWILTTPLLLITLLLRGRIHMVTPMVFISILAVMMVYTGILANLAQSQQDLYILWGISSFFFIMIFGYLFPKPIPRFQFYFLFVAWSVYPILWILHQSNLTISNDDYNSSIAALDIFSKIGYGLILHI